MRSFVAARPRGPNGICVVALFCSAACELQVPTPPTAMDAQITFEGSVDGDAGVPTVFLARSPKSEQPLPRLFLGALSDYHRSHADDAELPGTLQEREVPLWVQRRENEQNVMPLRPLEPRAQYSLMFAPGRAYEFVTRRQLPSLLRQWPSTGPAARAVYCKSTPSESSEARAEVVTVSTLDVSATSPAGQGSGALWPDFLRGVQRLANGSSAHWESLPGLVACALLEVDSSLGPEGDALGPKVAGQLISPSVFTHTAVGEPTVATECASGSALAPGCAEVQDDRVLLTYAEAPALWCFEADIAGCVASEPARAAVIRGLSPETTYAVQVSVRLADGAELSSSPALQTASVRPHVVLNEVLANPLGAEPAQEWVELYNDGSAPVNLLGWVLEDGAGQTLLPDVLLPAQGFALLVSDAFVNPPPQDLAPAPGASIIRVPRLGVSGLSNSGEPLLLRTPEGLVASAMPASNTAAGTSLARREPSTAGASESEVASHAAPGSSPGSLNTVSSAQP